MSGLLIAHPRLLFIFRLCERICDHENMHFLLSVLMLFNGMCHDKQMSLKSIMYAGFGVAAVIAYRAYKKYTKKSKSRDYKNKVKCYMLDFDYGLKIL